MLQPQGQSWLSLVAETAGVAGATIARVHLASADFTGSAARTCIVQAIGRYGQVIGATVWTGDDRQLRQGIDLDLGCDLAATDGAVLVGWSQEAPFDRNPRLAVPPRNHSVAPFEPTRAMKLMLRAPAQQTLQDSPAAA